MKFLILTILISIFLFSACATPARIPGQVNPYLCYTNQIADIKVELQKPDITSAERIALRNNLVDLQIAKEQAQERGQIRANQPTIIDQLFGIAASTAIISGITKAIWN